MNRCAGPIYIDGLVQDCSNFIANALELLQSCTKPSIYGTKNVSSPSSHLSYRMVQRHQEAQAIDTILFKLLQSVRILYSFQMTIIQNGRQDSVVKGTLIFS